MGTKGSAFTLNTAIVGGDKALMVDAPAGVPASNNVYWGDVNLLPSGTVVNGKISVTVSSNNITVALKTLDNADPSTTNPVSVWINGTFRRCTAALSVTKNAGTNWFSSGAAQFAAQERDYFVYLVWNTTPATDIVDIGFSPVPYGRVYSDFSSTSTVENYLASANASAPASTDDCVIIGRFAATLSAAASYNWSVPTFTNANLIQSPIYESRWLTYAPTLTGYSGTPTVTARYQVMNNRCRIDIDNATGTSNSTGWAATIPFTHNATTTFQGVAGSVYDNGVQLTGACRAGIVAGGTGIAVVANMAAGNFTASGTKTVYINATYVLK